MKDMFKKILIIFLIVLTSCEENQLTSLDSEDTDRSNWFQFIQHLNKKEFQEAIDLLVDIPDEIKLARENLISHSSAYAGLCGLDLISLINEADGLGGRTPIQFLMQTFGDPTPDKLAACQTAIDIIEDNVSEQAGQRNADENIAMMAYLMSGIGLFLNSRFDLNNDGTVDGAADSCSVTQLTDNQAARMGASLTKMFLASQFIFDVEFLSEMQAEIKAGCNEFDSIAAPLLNFCDEIDPTNYDANQIRGVRSILQEGVMFGMGSCASSPNDLVNCICI